MAGRGRPRKEEADKRTRQIRILLTEEERNEIKEAAKRNGYWNVSEFIRDSIREKAEAN